MSFQRIAILLAAVFSALVGPASGTTTSTTFQVQIVITNACVIGAVSTLNFGSQGTLAAIVPATTTIGVNCTLALPYNVGLDAGVGSGATVATRKMTGPASATVSYSLYQDVTHLLVWGNTIGTNTIAAVGTGLSVPYTVYGAVPIQATPAAGTYTDTITVTVTY
jgi:spore coat protein U-like protein